MRYVERRPRPALRACVECVWAAWEDDAVTERSPERIVPDGCPELIVHLGDPFLRLEGGTWKVQPPAFLAGSLTRPWTLRPGRRPKALGIRFRPGVAARILDVPMRETADRETRLDVLAGASAAVLVDAVREAPSIAAALVAAEDWMARRLGSRKVVEPEAGPAIGLFLASRGRMRVEDVARSLGWSRRRLERAFEFDLGLSPKRFARIVRLNAVLAHLDDAERCSAVDLALEAGYFDQAHLLRDFRGLAGASPRKLEAWEGELSRQLIRPGRLRALFEGG